MEREYYFRGIKTGVIKDDKVYISFRKMNVHFFFLKQGYPISVDILDDLKKRGIERIRIVAIESTGVNTYECGIQSYLDCEPFRNLVFPFEEQKCFPTRKMLKVAYK